MDIYVVKQVQKNVNGKIQGIGLSVDYKILPTSLYSGKP